MIVIQTRSSSVDTNNTAHVPPALSFDLYVQSRDFRLFLRLSVYLFDPVWEEPRRPQSRGIIRYLLHARLAFGDGSCCQKSAERSLPAGDAFTKNLIRKHRQTNVDVDCDVDDDDDSPVVYCVLYTACAWNASILLLPHVQPGGAVGFQGVIISAQGPHAGHDDRVGLRRRPQPTRKQTKS